MATRFASFWTLALRYIAQSEEAEKSYTKSFFGRDVVLSIYHTIEEAKKG